MKAVKNLTETISEKISDAVTGVSTSSVTHANTFTRATGCPFAEIKNSKTAGPNGPLVSDPELFEKLQRFDREKIPARNVHALGHGAYGKFTVTNDITRYSKASVFSRVGKTTELFARFSGIFTEQGEADTSRDPRGLAYKFYTDEGNWDLMTINTPVFAVRDSKPGPDQVHAFKRDPRSGMWNADQLWDFVATHPEGLHQGAMLFTDYYGTPCSYRFMEGYGCNTYSLINANNERVWVKFHLKNLQGGVRGFTAQQAKIIAGEDANFLGRDLWQAIEKGNYPKWRLLIQVMPEEEGYQKNFAFDCTKAWPQDQYPLIEVGEIEMNRNPVNYFSEVEQVAFSPATTVPGIGHSPDKLLQGRLLIYDDTQTHRIGPNYKQLYINRPHGIEPQNNYLGGNMNLEVKDKFPHYTPSVFGSLMPDKRAVEPPLRCDGPADYYDYPGEGSDEDYYGQVREYWNLLPQDQKINMCDNIASSLGQVKTQRIIDMMLVHFNKVSPDWGNLVKQKIDDRRAGKGLTDSEIMCQKFAKELLADSKSTV